MKTKRESNYIAVIAVALIYILAGMSQQVEAETQMYFVHTDHLGTPEVMTDKDKNVVWRADKKPFGETGVDGSIIESARFPGQFFDDESGLAYNYFRYYDPSIGRYINSDPIGLRGGFNTYGYVESNPTNYVDPYGLYGTAVIGLGVRVVGGRAAAAVGSRYLQRALG